MAGTKIKSTFPRKLSSSGTVKLDSSEVFSQARRGPYSAMTVGPADRLRLQWAAWYSVRLQNVSRGRYSLQVRESRHFETKVLPEGEHYQLRLVWFVFQLSLQVQIAKDCSFVNKNCVKPIKSMLFLFYTNF